MQQTISKRLRRLSVATLAGVAASAVLPLGVASAQATADPPPPTDVSAFCVNVPPGYQPFDDVSDSHTFAEAIRCEAYAGITLGVAPRIYDPVSSITRAQMATFLVRTIETANELELVALDDLPAYDGVNAFTDVSNAGTHVAAINRLADAGITLGGPGGLPSDEFGPLLPVQREQMASFVTRALEHLTNAERVATEDYFIDDETSTHEANINALAEVGIAVGDGEDLYNPGGTLDRGQMAAFIMRSMANLEIGDLVAPVPAVPVPSDEFSTTTSTDNGNGTATISFTVRNAENEGIDGLDAGDFSLRVPGQSTPSNLATLINDFPDVWGPFTDAEAGNGVYTVILTAEPGTYTYADLSALGVEIDPSNEVTITG